MHTHKKHTCNNSIIATIYFKFNLFLNNWNYLGEALQFSHCMLSVNEYLKLSTKIKSNVSYLLSLSLNVTEPGQGVTDSGKCSVPASFSLESIFRFF